MLRPQKLPCRMVLAKQVEGGVVESHQRIGIGRNESGFSVWMNPDQPGPGTPGIVYVFF
jgi:hypothetical protein